MLLNLKSKVNVYEQIVSEYEKLIKIGAIAPGDKLPSCRQLAKEYGINPNTVEKAYKALIDEGYIESIPKKGFYVMDRQNDTRLLSIKNEIIKIKDANITYNELIDIINDVYKGADSNDKH